MVGPRRNNDKYRSSGSVMPLMMMMMMPLPLTTVQLLVLSTASNAFLVSPNPRIDADRIWGSVAIRPNRNYFAISRTRIFMSSSSTGPKGDGRQRRSSHRRGGPSTSSSSSSTPTGQGGQQRSDPPQRRTPRQPSAFFDGKMLTAQQDSNHDAPPLDLESHLKSDHPTLRCVDSNIRFQDEAVDDPDNNSHVSRDHDDIFVYMSLDDLFPDRPNLNFSMKFNQDGDFRNELRIAIRQDMFDISPFYRKLSEKAASVLLLPDSSLQGSWQMPEDRPGELRMKRTSTVLQEGLGLPRDGDDDPTGVPITGDELFRAIGKLCGGPSTHWIDICGVQDRTINHSWHLDAGSSPGNCKTVLWGFPSENDYTGTGVFTHMVRLANSCLADPDHPPILPILFDGSIDEQYIIRPIYKTGKELMMYRDIDVVHSAPDVTYRSSVMRFM